MSNDTFIVVKLSNDSFERYYKVGLLETLYIKCVALKVDPQPLSKRDDSEIDININVFNDMINGTRPAYAHYRG